MGKTLGVSRKNRGDAASGDAAKRRQARNRHSPDNRHARELTGRSVGNKWRNAIDTPRPLVHLGEV
jgi:hypothetical protein